MTLTWLWAFLRTRTGRYALIGFAVVAGVLGLRAKWQGEGAANERQEMRDDVQQRVEAGRDAVRDGRGGDPDERLRKNDGNWR